MTTVSDEDFEFLLKNSGFKSHVDNGFITYDKKKVENEKKLKDMEKKDGSSPRTPDDFVKSENSTKDTPIYRAKDQKAG